MRTVGFVSHSHSAFHNPENPDRDVEDHFNPLFIAEWQLWGLVTNAGKQVHTYLMLGKVSESIRPVLQSREAHASVLPCWWSGGQSTLERVWLFGVPSWSSIDEKASNDKPWSRLTPVKCKNSLECSKTQSLITDCHVLCLTTLTTKMRVCGKRRHTTFETR